MTAEIRQQFAKLATDLANGQPKKLARTWGFEIETPEADKIYNQTTRDEFTHLNFTQDQSVKSEDGRGEDCDCDCRDCNYHDCDCMNCEEQNTDPEHGCGSRDCYSCGQYQEITSIGGLDNTHPEALALLEAKGLDECSVNDTCGLHIHIGSADLSPFQVASVIRAYRVVAGILEPIAGRRDTYYANDNTEADIRRAIDGDSTEKYKAVNTAHHFNGGRWGKAQTLEFRQHGGTNDTARVRAWAYLLVRLVEFGKSGKDLYWLAKAKDLDEVLAIIR